MEMKNSTDGINGRLISPKTKIMKCKTEVKRSEYIRKRE